MPNTVLSCPWMREKDAVPYVAPPELFREDSPRPWQSTPPSKVPVEWVADAVPSAAPEPPVPQTIQITATPSPIPAILSPVPVKASPPSPDTIMTCRSILSPHNDAASCGLNFPRHSTISPTDSTRIGDLQMEEQQQEQQRNPASPPPQYAPQDLVVAHMETNPTSASLLPSFDSAFDAVVASVSQKMMQLSVTRDDPMQVTPSTHGHEPLDSCGYPSRSKAAKQEDAATVLTSATSDDSSGQLPTPSDAPHHESMGQEEVVHATMVSHDDSVSSPDRSELSAYQADVSADDATVRAVNESWAVESPPATPSSRSSSTTSRRSRLLVLVDMKSCSQTAVMNQLYMFTVFSCSRILYDKVDVSNPKQAALCRQLEALAMESSGNGSLPSYPQFFLAREDGSVSFWGGWERFFETADNKGRLMEEMEFPERCCDSCRSN